MKRRRYGNVRGEEKILILVEGERGWEGGRREGRDGENEMGERGRKEGI